MLNKEDKKILLSKFKKAVGNSITAESAVVKSLDDINYSGVLTKLIQIAGRTCTHYASDMIITWNIALDDLKEAIEKKKSFKGSYFFGFRDMGVDGESFIFNRTESPEIYGENVYKSIYRLDVSIKTAKNSCFNDGYVGVFMELYPVFMCDK